MSEEEKIITRKEAKSLGLKHYFTGKPCKRGHVSERRTDNGDCLCCRPIQFSNWVGGDDARGKDRSLKYYYDNIEKCRKKSLLYYMDNKDSRREYKKNWQKLNPSYSRDAKAKRKARKAKAGGTYNQGDIDRILITQKYKCAEPTCRKDLSLEYHVDHIMPLALGGDNWPSNLQCLCPACNLRKHAKHPLDWAKENGRLL